MPMTAFLNIKGIEGESKDDKHAKQIEILSYSQGVAQAGSFGKDGKMTNASAQFGDFSIMKNIDKTSPLIAEYCCSGKKINTVILEICAMADGKMLPFMKYELAPALISSVQQSGSSDTPVESVAFHYHTLKWEFTPYDDQKAGDAVRSGWDI